MKLSFFTFVYLLNFKIRKIWFEVFVCNFLIILPVYDHSLSNENDITIIQLYALDWSSFKKFKAIILAIVVSLYMIFITFSRDITVLHVQKKAFKSLSQLKKTLSRQNNVTQQVESLLGVTKCYMLRSICWPLQVVLLAVTSRYMLWTTISLPRTWSLKVVLWRFSV